MHHFFKKAFTYRCARLLFPSATIVAATSLHPAFAENKVPDADHSLVINGITMFPKKIDLEARKEALCQNERLCTILASSIIKNDASELKCNGKTKGMEHMIGQPKGKDELAKKMKDIKHAVNDSKVLTVIAQKENIEDALGLLKHKLGTSRAECFLFYAAQSQKDFTQKDDVLYLQYTYPMNLKVIYVVEDQPDEYYKGEMNLSKELVDKYVRKKKEAVYITLPVLEKGEAKGKGGVMKKGTIAKKNVGGEEIKKTAKKEMSETSKS